MNLFANNRFFLVLQHSKNQYTMKKIAIVLSGCGVYDGAEIHEAVMTMYAIVKQGAEYQIFAPDINQHHVVNHITGQVVDETRNVLVEAARIARGNVKPLSELDVNQYDGLIFPGGFGVAKNLSSFAFDGANCSVNDEVKALVLKMVELKKPIGALCIAPAMIAKILGNATVTIGNEKEPADEIEKIGCKHVQANHGEVIIDKKYKLVTSPCYMLDANIVQIAEGAENTINAMFDLMV